MKNNDKIITLAPQAILTDGLQLRAETSRVHIDEIAELFDEENPTWPPELPEIDVYFDGTKYHMADGHHRLAGAIQAGCTEVRVRIHRGSRADALWHAIGSNAGHGLKRSNEDKRRAVLKAFDLDPKLREKGKLREVARRCKVSHTYATMIFREQFGKANEQSASEQVACGAGNVATPESKPFSPPGNTDWIHKRPSNPENAKPLPPEPNPLPPQPKEQPSAKEESPHGQDQLGIPLPTTAAAKAFAALDFFEQLDRHLIQAAKMIDQLGQMPGAELLRSEYLKLTSETRDGATVVKLHSHDLENLRRELKHWRPYSQCPHCQASPKATCKVCLGLPFATKTAFERCPEKIREAVLRLRQT